VSIALTSGADILVTESSKTSAAPLSPSVTIRFDEIVFEYEIKFASLNASVPVIFENSTSLGTNQSVNLSKLSDGIFAGAGLRIVEIPDSLATANTFSCYLHRYFKLSN
jgi:hypothetical protein